MKDSFMWKYPFKAKKLMFMLNQFTINLISFNFNLNKFHLM